MKNKKEIDEDDDEAPISPFSREYLYGKPEQNIYCAMGLKYPIELQSLKKAFSNPIILKHPRFCSLMVRDNNGAEHWKKTHVNLDDHFIIHHSPAASFMEGGRKEEEEEDVNDFLAGMALSDPLSMGKPLWEVHVLMGSNCVVLRVHHALGDGPSMMSMLWECFGKNNNGVKIYEHGKKKERRKSSGGWGLIMSLWLTLVFGMRLVGRLFGVKDDKSVIFGGDGVEFWPRKLVTTKFKLEDFKSIKKFIPNVTVNDVLLGVISSGLSKYLASKSPDGIQLTGVVAVNLRKGPGLQEMSKLMKARAGSLSAWGNKTGGILLPIHCCKGVNPLEQVSIMKSIMDQKKHSYEAHLPYLTVHFVTSFLGPKAARWCYHKLLCSTTLGISNIMGPPDEMVIADNPVTYLKVTASSIPQSMVVHLVSYAGTAYLQVMVAKDIIHDSEFLVNCFEEALLEMKNNCSKKELVESVIFPPKGVKTS